MTSARRVLGLATLLLGLAACVTVPPSNQLAFCAPIDDAITAPLPDLRARAEQGEAMAQLEYSILLRNGLRGMEVDVSGAKDWRFQATKPRSVAMMGSLPVYTYGIDIVRRVAIEDCADALGVGGPLSPASAARGTCGGEANYRRLAAAWNAAKRPRS